MKTIFICEYVTGGGYINKKISKKLFVQANIILKSLFNDFNKIPNLKIIYTWDYRYKEITKRKGTISDSDFTGYRIRIANFGNIDVEIDLVLALDTTDTLLIYVEQIGGEGTVLRIDQLFRIEKPTVQGGYMVLPHGSGYLVDSDCAEELPGTRSDTDLIGARWTLPMFGMVRGDNTLFVIVEDWWDCEVKVEHKPDLFSAIEFNWIPSLGSLN